MNGIRITEYRLTIYRTSRNYGISIAEYYGGWMCVRRQYRKTYEQAKRFAERFKDEATVPCRVHDMLAPFYGPPKPTEASLLRRELAEARRLLEEANRCVSHCVAADQIRYGVDLSNANAERHAKLAADIVLFLAREG